MGVHIFNSCIVLLAVLFVCFDTIDGAAINANALAPATSSEYFNVRAARQAYSDEDDSEEDDEVQALNFAQEQQQQQLPYDSQEDSEEDGEDDGDSDRRRRRRRETIADEAEKIEQSAVPLKELEAVAVPEPLPAPTTTDAVAQTDTSKEPTAQSGEEPNTVTAAAAAPSRNTSVLILIRDALKKVTTIPTEQVATNALQYFQLFEKFIQQTIEDVIGDDDDDEDEAIATTIKPDEIFTPEEEELIAGIDEILIEPELVTKQPLPEKPTETQMEVVDQKLVESNAIVGETKPAPGVLKPEAAQQEKLTTVVDPANVTPAA